MRTYEKRLPQPREYDHLVKMTCDLCGKTNPTCSDNWSTDWSGVGEVEIKQDTGYRYADSANVKTLSFDVCPDCFRDKVIPWFKARGATPRESEVDW